MTFNSEKQIDTIQQRYRTDAPIKAAGIPDRHLSNIGIVETTNVQGWIDRLNLLDQQVQHTKGFLIGLVGIRGTGKTQLASTLLYRNCRRGFPSRYEKAGDFFRLIRATYTSNTTSEDSIFRRYASYDLLVLDEWHERSSTEAESTALTTLIDKRYDARKSTLLIGNVTPAEFNKNVGASIASRMNETGTILVCDWPTFRLGGNWRAGDNDPLRKTSLLTEAT